VTQAKTAHRLAPNPGASEQPKKQQRDETTASWGKIFANLMPHEVLMSKIQKEHNNSAKKQGDLKVGKGSS
jgi:hypothetical protein